jgi:hypothetical protein
MKFAEVRAITTALKYRVNVHDVIADKRTEIMVDYFVHPMAFEDTLDKLIEIERADNEVTGIGIDPMGMLTISVRVYKEVIADA